MLTKRHSRFRFKRRILAITHYPIQKLYLAAKSEQGEKISNIFLDFYL